MSKTTFSNFRGSLVAVSVMVILLLLVSRTETEQRSQLKTLMSFDPYLLNGIEITRSGQTITLQEIDGQWHYLEVNEAAAMVMINRVRHQLHDLKSRAFVSNDNDEFLRYGIDTDSEHVDLMFADGQRLQLVVGDLNPTGVSHYVLIPQSNEVHTVQKAALDYFTYSSDLYRDDRLIPLSQESIKEIRIEPSRLATNSKTWRFENVNERQKPLKRRWRLRIGDGLDSEEVQADSSKVSQLIGRLLALKASTFIDTDDNEYQRYKDFDWQDPLFYCELIDGKSEALRITFGPRFDDNNVVVMLGNRDQYFVVRSGVLEDVVLNKSDWTSKLLLDIDENAIETVNVSLNGSSINLRRSADQWLWATGVPVSGSTPDRLVRTISGLISRGTIATKPDDNSKICSIQINGAETSVSIFSLSNDDSNHFILVNSTSEGLISHLLFSICEDVERESKRSLGTIK